MLGSALLPSSARRFARLAVDLRPARPQWGDVSQNGEYSYLKWLIPSDWPRTMVEVGANDGLTYSNSYNLLRDGWKAVLVEPHPENYKRLVENTGSVDAILFEAAASESAGSADLFEDTATDGHNLMATLQTTDSAWYDATRSDRSVPVKLRRLDEMLDEAGFDHDFSVLSADTEGHDAAVLAGMGAYTPRVILTERDLNIPAQAHVKQQELTRRGYLVVDRVGCNEIYMHRDRILEAPQILS
ncbi:FkbM family methyltransferase [Nocardioides psychrotolerans]|uniref:FkbM family methyltransferase n=1 Tax=Nocardioides psychrotolerans TaxID=1005945 RepID=UPI003137997A